MKVLFIVPYVPDLIRVRPYNLIRYLAQAGHEVTVLTLWTSEQEKQAAVDLEKHGCRVQAFHLPKWRSYLNALLTVPTSAPLQASYCWFPPLVDHAVKLTNGNGPSAFDVVHVEHLRGARFGLALKARLSQLPVVWDSVDSISHLFRQAMANSKRISDRLVTGFELGRTERYEGWLVGQFDRTLVTSLADKTALENLRAHVIPHKPSAISVVQNGVDLEFFKPDPDVRRAPATLVLTGKMSYHANIAMALYLLQEIMPKVWAVREDVRVNIVGKDPPPVIQALAQEGQVNVTGTVPDLRPYLQQATLAVAPITYGAGIQNKILEAMACATPVITTQKAVAGLRVTPDENILVAQDAEAFASTILRMFNAPYLQHNIGLAGRHYVEKYHHWGEVASQLSVIYRQVI
jgi:glycosyltransferase involved in cell wall biosynthesis